MFFVTNGQGVNTIVVLLKSVCKRDTLAHIAHKSIAFVSMTTPLRTHTNSQTHLEKTKQNTSLFRGQTHGTAVSLGECRLVHFPGVWEAAIVIGRVVTVYTFDWSALSAVSIVIGPKPLRPPPNAQNK